MKYEKEVNEILKESWRESWMNDKDYEEVENSILNAIGVTKQKLSDDLERGIQNGYSVDSQRKIICAILKMAEKPKQQRQ